MDGRAKVFAAVAGGVAVATGTYLVGEARWKRGTAARVARLHATAGRAQPHAYSREQLVGLPDPVVHYFEFALLPGQSRVARARLRQAGELRTAANAAWSRFSATEYFRDEPPGFVWDASVEAAPLRLRVRDSYVASQGESLVSLAGLVTVGELPASPQLAAAGLARYLAECIWFPTALLPRRNLAWSALGDRRARVTLRDGEESAWLDVDFGPDGAIERASTQRYRDIGGAFVLTPWTGRLRGYERIQGMMIPTEAEVEWAPPEGAVPVWRARILRADFGFG